MGLIKHFLLYILKEHKGRNAILVYLQSWVHLTILQTSYFKAHNTAFTLRKWGSDGFRASPPPFIKQNKQYEKTKKIKSRIQIYMLILNYISNVTFDKLVIIQFFIGLFDNIYVTISIINPYFFATEK